MGLAAEVVYDLKIKERRGYLFKNQKKLMKNVQIWYEYGTKIVPKLDQNCIRLHTISHILFT